MEPFSLALGLVTAGVALSREIREWRTGRRSKLELATDRTGQLHSLQHDGAALMAPQALLPAYVQPSLLYGTFELADDVAARRLSAYDPTLVMVWPTHSDPAFESIVFTCDLSQTFELELAGGMYHVAALVLDERRDDIRGGADYSNLQVPWSSTVELTLGVQVSETEWESDQLAAVLGETPAELLLPDGIRVPLNYNTLIGRDEGCTVVMEDLHVDLRHAQIQFVNDHYRIYDLGSTNGTYVNNQSVTGGWPLRHGDIISIAGYGLEFRYR